MRLQNKTALVTGGAGAIGRAVVEGLLAEGARVAVVDRNADLIAGIVSAADPERLIAISADVSQEADVVRYCAEAKGRFGALDIVFNNAGISGPVRPLTELGVDEFDAIMAVNVRGVFLGLKHALPVMADGGSIIVTSSVAGLHAAPFLAGYAASKHAVMGLVKTAAREAASRRIRVNAINPGPVEGPMMRGLEEGFSPVAPDTARERLVRQMRLGRYVTPREIAELVLFLGSDESRMITGQAHTIDAGLTA